MSNKKPTNPNYIRKRKFKIWPNMYVMVDPNNEMRQVDYGLGKALTIRRIKWRPFGKSIWEVCDPEATGNNIGKTAYIPENLLYPLGIVVTRLPADMPIINEKDMQNIKLIRLFIDNLPEQVVRAYLPQGWTKFDKKEVVNRLDATYLKLKHCRELRDL